MKQKRMKTAIRSASAVLSLRSAVRSASRSTGQALISTEWTGRRASIAASRSKPLSPATAAGDTQTIAA